ncbi:hypothetical protein BLNAU_12604 [Blattamonas nauphoetae]|uniref:Uncharacterized protein n=1 Tax=Blattamonas nauphoetae TaxID=2049346 RepID=A0ABQ9XQG8_9EUKA|nr:hypothetical protein BLNAU_12604 [Blattamonas nauphoetae]
MIQATLSQSPPPDSPNYHAQIRRGITFDESEPEYYDKDRNEADPIAREEEGEGKEEQEDDNEAKQEEETKRGAEVRKEKNGQKSWRGKKPEIEEQRFIEDNRRKALEASFRCEEEQINTQTPSQTVGSGQRKTTETTILTNQLEKNLSQILNLTSLSDPDQFEANVIQSALSSPLSIVSALSMTRSSALTWYPAALALPTIANLINTSHVTVLRLRMGSSLRAVLSLDESLRNDIKLLLSSPCAVQLEIHEEIIKLLSKCNLQLTIEIYITSTTCILLHGKIAKIDAFLRVIPPVRGAHGTLSYLFDCVDSDHRSAHHSKGGLHLVMRGLPLVKWGLRLVKWGLVPVHPQPTNAVAGSFTTQTMQKPTRRTFSLDVTAEPHPEVREAELNELLFPLGIALEAVARQSSSREATRMPQGHPLPKILQIDVSTSHSSLHPNTKTERTSVNAAHCSRTISSSFASCSSAGNGGVLFSNKQTASSSDTRPPLPAHLEAIAAAVSFPSLQRRTSGTLQLTRRSQIVGAEKAPLLDRANRTRRPATHSMLVCPSRCGSLRNNPCRGQHNIHIHFSTRTQCLDFVLISGHGNCVSDPTTRRCVRHETWQFVIFDTCHFGFLCSSVFCTSLA